MKREKAYAIINAIKELRAAITDEEALKYPALYPEWQPGIQLAATDRIEYNGKLYKVIQSHITQLDWTPDTTFALFEPIDLDNKGTIDNPIIAAVGMTYIKDMYYLDETDDNVYLCIRSDAADGSTLYYMPNALVGIYFEKINK